MDSITPHVVEDFEGIIQLYSDGSIIRSTSNIPFNFPDHDDGTVIWQDFQFDNKNDLYLRLYRPNLSSNSSTKLPILYFFHGGGFCVGSRTWPNFHNCCLRLSSGLNAIIVAPDYRLAPENRLPAAIDDALHAVKWLQGQASSKSPDTTWVCDLGDFDKVYIIGDSSGGNMAHHLAVQLGPGSPELAPVKVRGYILMAPFFGGIQRTKSEVEGLPEKFLTLEFLDKFWRLSLPVGDTADDPLANPFGPSSPNLETMKLDPILVIVGGSELLKDRVRDYANKLKELKKKIRYIEFERKEHGFFTNDSRSQTSDKVLKEIEYFMSENSL